MSPQVPVSPAALSSLSSPLFAIDGHPPHPLTTWDLHSAVSMTCHVTDVEAFVRWSRHPTLSLRSLKVEGAVGLAMHATSPQFYATQVRPTPPHIPSL